MTPLRLPVRAFHLAFEALDPITPPHAIGAMWRGVLGRALLRRDQGLYKAYFDAKAVKGLSERYDDPPSPFALEASAPNELVAQPGDALNLWLKIFGDAPAQPLFDAFSIAAEAGLGKGRGRAKLISISPIWSEQAQRQDATRIADAARIAPEFPPSPPPPPVVRVALISPLRLRVGGAPLMAKDFTAEIWMRALRRRLALLLALYGEGAPPSCPDAAPLLREPQLWSVPMHRWSARQKREIDMTGVMGSFALALEGIEAFWPALWLGQWAQVGSATNAGLGAYRLKIP